MRGWVLNARACFQWRLTLFAVTALISSCTVKEFRAVSVTAPHVEPAKAPIVAQSYRETGIASWYGKDYNGRKTASGEIFDMYGLSAAHRTLPLGTIIRITNLDNFRSIRVKINDRGPFAGNRILEVSYGAARELAFVAQGSVPVKIETVEQPNEPAAYFTVQAATFSEEENAKLLKERLAKKFEMISIIPYESNLGKFYRVRVGSYTTEEKAEVIAGKLKLEGLEPYVVRKD